MSHEITFVRSGGIYTDRLLPTALISEEGDYWLC